MSHRFKVLTQCRVDDPNRNRVGEGVAECLK